jgi:LEA14-like dessication related protein
MNLKKISMKIGGLMIATGLLLLSGSAGLGPESKPRVSLANLQVQEVRGLETVFLVELRVLNPGDTPLQLRGIDYELLVDGHPFATGLSGGSYEVPVYASMLDMVSSVVSRLKQPAPRPGSIDPLRYEVTGQVRLAGTMGGTRTLPFASKGELSLSGQQR